MFRRTLFIVFCGLAAACSRQGDTPPRNSADIADANLAKAILAGDEAAVRKSLDANPSLVNKFNANGETPLHYAARSKNAAIIQLLLAKGADVSLKNDSDETPADVASDNNAGDDIVQLLKGGAK